jgi:hypothetical protein
MTSSSRIDDSHIARALVNTLRFVLFLIDRSDAREKTWCLPLEQPTKFELVINRKNMRTRAKSKLLLLRQAVDRGSSRRNLIRDEFKSGEANRL